MSKRVAIVGGGIAGLTAAYHLKDRCEITLYEKLGRIGGNACTHRTKDGYEADIAVAAFGKSGYPNFFRLLNELGVECGRSLNSNVSFYNLDTKKGVYITPFSLKALVAQNFSMFSPGNLRAFYQLSRGLDEAKQLLRDGKLAGKTMAEAFAGKKWFQGEVKAFFLCALCLLSSMQAEEIMQAPAEFFIRKLDHHDDLISAKSFYSITAVKNGTKSYVGALAKDIAPRIQKQNSVRQIERTGGKVFITDQQGSRSEYDEVVVATPADEALRLLKDPSKEEKQILGKWKYKAGRIVVHSDAEKFPRRELMQAYTFLYTDRNGVFDTSVSGSLWHEPGVAPDCPYISSQHPNFPIDPQKIDLDTVFYTPVYDKESVPVIPLLPSLNGQKQTYFCGSYFGFGLHEDAVTSAINAANMVLNA